MDTAQLATLAILVVAVLALISRLWVVNKRTNNPHSDHELLVEIRDSLEVISRELVEIRIHVENTWAKVNQ